MISISFYFFLVKIITVIKSQRLLCEIMLPCFFYPDHFFLVQMLQCGLLEENSLKAPFILTRAEISPNFF